MKILHITNACGWSGGLEQMLLLLSELHKRGHENILACPPESELLARLPAAAARRRPLRMHQDYDLLAAWKLRRIVLREIPDVVHSHHAMAHAVALVALQGLARPPLLVSRRVSFPPRRNPFSVWKYRSRRIGGYAVVSESVKATLTAGGIDAGRVEVIYSAVDPARFKPARGREAVLSELKLPAPARVVGKVANFSKWKGQQIFLEAAALCSKKIADARFVLAGKDTENLAADVRRLDIEPRVRLLGFRKDVPDILSTFDLSVNAAVEGEGLSGALRESLAMGIPVLASDVAGNREIVRGGAAGYLVAAGDPVALAEKMAHVLSHPEEARQKAQVGKKWVMENATLDCMVSHTLSLYASLIAGGKK